MPFLLSKINDCHPFAFGGHRLNGIYVALYDAMTCAWGDTFGYNRVSDFGAYYASSGGVPASYGSNRPHLYGITKAEALPKFGATVTTFFHHAPPRFGFTLAEQEQLLWASEGGTDEYLSCVAPVTIRKRWDAVYARVAATEPDFFGAVTAEGGKRGGEKRRRLLSYLTHHREELRPHCPPVSPAE